MKDPEKAYEYWCEAKDVANPSKEQIDRAEGLLRRLGYDVDDYDFEDMDRWEVSDLIEALKEEWGN